LPLKYLGLPLGAVIRQSVFRMVLSKRLSSGWLVESGCISKGCRVTLLKSTLSNLPTYFLSLFSILASVANRIEKFYLDFYGEG
jgi:hypothetical protein